MQLSWQNAQISTSEFEILFRKDHLIEFAYRQVTCNISGSIPLKNSVIQFSSVTIRTRFIGYNDGFQTKWKSWKFEGKYNFFSHKKTRLDVVYSYQTQWIYADTWLRILFVCMYEHRWIDEDVRVMCHTWRTFLSCIYLVQNAMIINFHVLSLMYLMTFTFRNFWRIFRCHHKYNTLYWLLINLGGYTRY